MWMDRDGPYWLLAAATAAWLLLILSAPLARAEEWAAAPWLYAFFGPICHQLPERSFAAFGEALAVCHRCSGLYGGFFLGLLAWPFLPAAGRRLLAAPRWIVAFALPLLLDVAWPGNLPPIRFATGLLAAFPVALLALAALEQIFRPVQEAHSGGGDHELDVGQ